jgi:glycosyltransferase involved in cell wall biosynthesis
LEYIVQDGGSTDNTAALVKNFKGYIKHFESRKDNGQAHAINLGFRHATGEIMAYLNSDDMLLPGTLSYVANYFSAHDEVDVVYGHRLIVDEDDKVIGDWIMPPHDDEIMRWTDYIPQETVFWRRRIWDKVGSHIDESFQFAMDWDLLLRFQEAGAVFKRLPRFLAAFRVHSRQKTLAQITDIGKKEVVRLHLRNFGREVDAQEIGRHTHKFLIRSVWHHWAHKFEIKKHGLLACLHNEQKSISWYPRESVYFYSVHKAGTALFTHILRQANELTHIDYETMLFDNELSEEVTFQKYGKLYGVFRMRGANEPEMYSRLTKHISTAEFVKDKTIVILVRDPRDILISFYYSFGFTHVLSANPRIANGLQKLRAQIQSQSLDEFAIAIAPDILKRFEILHKLSKACKCATVLKYEELIDHFDDFIDDFSKYISIPEEKKQELFLASRPRDEEDRFAHKRSGKIGQYREKLKPETIQKINQILKPALEKFDYCVDVVPAQN